MQRLYLFDPVRNLKAARFARRSLAAIAIASGIALGAQAQVEPTWADQWEVTTTTQTNGKSTAPQITRICLAKGLKDEKYIPARAGCKITVTERIVSTVNYTMVCEGSNPATIAGEIAFGPAVIYNRMKTTGTNDESEEETRMTYKLIGDCPILLRPPAN